MKNILLLRHAKSSWKNKSLIDIDRPLNKRGKNDAPLMAERFASINIFPDLIISSSSKRTVSTVNYFGEILSNPYEFIITEKLYLASSDTLLEILNNVDEKFRVVMLVGHNPGITDLANKLSNKFIENIPTCGLVGFSYNGIWAELKNKSCEFIFFEYPKKFNKN